MFEIIDKIGYYKSIKHFLFYLIPQKKLIIVKL